MLFYLIYDKQKVRVGGNKKKLDGKLGGILEGIFQKKKIYKNWGYMSKKVVKKC